MGRKKIVVETADVKSADVIMEVIESEKNKAEPKQEKIDKPVKNLVKVRILASISVSGGAEYDAGQVVEIPDYIYNQIEQSCVKL